MTIPPFIKNLFSGGASDLVKNITNLVDESKFSAEEKATFEAAAAELIEKRDEHKAEMAQRQLEAYLKDMDSARNMQIEALKNNDVFSKRFIYYLTIGVVLMTFAFDMCLFFIQYPERNHDLVNMICGIINTAGFASIMSFFYGSTKGSERKTESLERMATGK